MDSFELPLFSVLIGRNGIGKTHILDAIENGQIAAQGPTVDYIKKYDIDTFRPAKSTPGDWKDSQNYMKFTERVFPESPTLSLPEQSKDIFENHLKNILVNNSKLTRDECELKLRAQLTKFRKRFDISKISNEHDTFSYFLELRNLIFHFFKLKEEEENEPRRRKNDRNRGFDPAVALTMALSSSGKFLHELSRSEILQAANYEGETIENRLSQIFTQYKFDQYVWAHRRGERNLASFKELMQEYRNGNRPPWEILRDTLEHLRQASDDPYLFNFSFSDPDKIHLNFDGYQNFRFQTEFTNQTTGENYPIENLSSGEKILLALSLAAFNQSGGQRQPELLLLDEIDALLHPSMISALIAGLKHLFVENGTQVILATHSLTTISLLNEGEIFRVTRNRGKVNVGPVLKSEAVSELSEGLATIDVGLRIASTDNQAPVTILTEGNNVLHLKRWADLFFPDKVHIFDKLSDKTGKDQLFQYGRLLAAINLSSHFILVWDSDAKSVAAKLSRELPVSGNVTAFSFKKFVNRYSEKGIENLYDEGVLRKYLSKIHIDAETGEETSGNLNEEKKMKFAQHVFSEGTEEYFKNFGELRKTVQQILKLDA